MSPQPSRLKDDDVEALLVVRERRGLSWNNNTAALSQMRPKHRSPLPYPHFGDVVEMRSYRRAR